ncbi:hypothetical protein SAMN05660226_02358 [Parapedobacter luteus]|uniref:Uncharacterized protein n=1 Tax=Parapedobacter luteus TaxID=623280 RepID=A0A1T5CUB2_9SPHI|nr:hypothetical protein SAMN05660226_02358 [Parapedobacter luteus]
MFSYEDILFSVALSGNASRGNPGIYVRARLIHSLYASRPHTAFLEALTVGGQKISRQTLPGYRHTLVCVRKRRQKAMASPVCCTCRVSSCPHRLRSMW